MSHTTEELYDLYQITVRRARIAHRCSACDLGIEPGDHYAYVIALCDGTARNVKRCGRCEKVHEHLRDMGGADTWPDERLACGQDYGSEWGDEPPGEIQAVLFMTSDEASALLVPGARYDMMSNSWPVTVPAARRAVDGEGTP